MKHAPIGTSVDDLCRVLRALGFAERIKGSHHIFTKDGVAEILNLQPLSGGKAKAYQVKQVREVVTKYRLVGEADEGDEAQEQEQDQENEGRS